jgi:predicted RNase H-like nuclease (RuvC/YqgF family)
MKDVSVLISFIMALVSVGAWLLNRRESKARIKESESKTENFDTITDKLRGEIVEQLRDQLGKQNEALVTQNKQLISDLERLGIEIKNLKTENREKDERFESETNRWRDGYRRLEERIRGAESDLRVEREEKSRLYRELIDTKRISDQATRKYIDEIDQLKNNQAVHDTEIKKLQTGQLPARDELNRNVGT